MNNIEYFSEALINGKIQKDVFKCHKDTKISLSNMDLMIDRQLLSNEFVLFRVFFGWKSEKNPLYSLKMNYQNIINTEK
jgi:hypothetical protein